MLRVRIDKKIYQAVRGENLREFLLRSGIFSDAPCKGRGSCGQCRVRVNGSWQKACRYQIVSDIEVVLPKEERIECVPFLCETQRETERMALVLDLGTTTLALGLFSLDDGKMIRIETAVNPQREYGADVISRIASVKKIGAEPLRRVLFCQLHHMWKKLCPQTGSVDRLFVAGNMVMLHLFLGEDPTGMGEAPYQPRFLHMQRRTGNELGLDFVREVVTLPGISAFVGADLVAGCYAVGISKKGYRLLVDLGTNAEIVLFSGEKIYATSAAAGPCFEGGNISCGMSACEGAVQGFVIDAAGKPHLTLVGISDQAKGICGTGLVDLIAELLRVGILDETGYLTGETYEVAPQVYLTQEDVRQFQMAKSAVFTGMELLLQEAAISWEEVEEIAISGGFTMALSIEHACRVGLLPKEALDKGRTYANSCLCGLMQFAIEQEGGCLKEENLKDLEENPKVVSLDMASHPKFMETYIANLNFINME